MADEPRDISMTSRDIFLLTIITVTKADPAGAAVTLTSADAWRGLRGVEHIVVDGGGSSLDLVSCSGWSHLRQTGSGISAAFNEGLAAASGEWIWFLNGGDRMHEALDPAWLLALLRRTQADVVTGAVQFDGEAKPRVLPHASYQWPLIACWLAHPATLVRRELLVRAGGFDEKLRIAMDYDLWFRVLRRPVVVDAISVPIARFDTGGISERASYRAIARREEAKVVLRHAPSLVWSGFWLGLRIVRRLGWAALRYCGVPVPRW